jgi:hypothetical protein
MIKAANGYRIIFIAPQLWDGPQQAVLKGEAEDWARGHPLLGKRLQRPYRSGVSQLGGSLVEGNLVAGLSAWDLKVKKRAAQACSLRTMN